MNRPTPKQVRKWSSCAVLVTAAIMLLLAWAELYAAAALCCALLFGVLILQFILYRCPHCNGYLDRNAGDYCQHCGKKLP